MRVAASNGVKPQYRALAVIKLNVPVTPKEINDHCGTGDYAAKYITFLRRDGFVFTVQKDGRKVTTYTLISEPENAESFRNMQPKAPAPKPVKKEATVKVAAAKKKTAPAKTKAPAKTPAKAKVRKDFDEVEDTFGTTGEVGAIDSGWDSFDGLDLKSLL